MTEMQMLQTSKLSQVSDFSRKANQFSYNGKMKSWPATLTKVTSTLCIPVLLYINSQNIV